jgi:hypothetical protein
VYTNVSKHTSLNTSRYCKVSIVTYARRSCACVASEFFSVWTPSPIAKGLDTAPWLSGKKPSKAAFRPSYSPPFPLPLPLSLFRSVLQVGLPRRGGLVCQQGLGPCDFLLRSTSSHEPPLVKSQEQTPWRRRQCICACPVRVSSTRSEPTCNSWKRERTGMIKCVHVVGSALAHLPFGVGHGHPKRLYGFLCRIL